jgi:hypothetical protein
VSLHELTLDQLGTVARGRSRHRPRDAAFLYGGPYPFVQTGDVKSAGLYLRDFDQTYSEAGLAQSKLWPAGTTASGARIRPTLPGHGSSATFATSQFGIRASGGAAFSGPRDARRRRSAVA